jgi:SecD/SecF fusion protein
MRIRYYWFTATILLTIFGITVFVIRGEKGLNVDFVGGTVYGGVLKEKLELGKLREQLTEDRQNKILAIAENGVDKKDDKVFEITYTDGSKHTVYLTESLTPTQVRDRAKLLPDHSVEQVFVGDREFSEGNASRYFNIRTTEKERDIAELSINRLLKSELQRIVLKKYVIAKDGKQVTLEFEDPDTNQPAFASPAQVQMLLQREFKLQDLEIVAKGIALSKLGEDEKEGRYNKMALDLPDQVSEEKLKTVLDATQREFANRPLPVRLENFGSQLAADTQTRALYAILASWGAILLFLWFRFGSWTFGAAAVLCLVHDLFFTLGIIAFCHYLHEMSPAFSLLIGIQDFKIDLPTVAALLTLVGYSVNDTIVVFDRIREVRGKNPLLTAQTINDGVNQTLSRTLLTSFSVWLVVIVLYIFGGEGVHLFAFVMVVGVVVGTYSSIYIASPLLLIFGEGAPKVPSRNPQREAALVNG